MWKFHLHTRLESWLSFDLASVKVTFYTTEKSTKSMGAIDAITVATAISSVADKLNLK